MNFQLDLPKGSDETKYRQISLALQEAINCGRIKAGTKLPSVRDLSLQLNVSRETVWKSYDDLVTSGFAYTIAGSGTFVSDDAAVEPPETPVSIEHQQAPVHLSQYGHRLRNSGLRSELYEELNFSAPAQEDLPLSIWRELVNKSAREQQDYMLNYVSDEFGYRPLREALAAYFARNASANVSADNISVSGSTETGIDGLCRILFDPGDTVAVEEPGFSGARCALKLAGAKLLSVPLDEQGLSVSYLREHGKNVRLVYITPLHDPTGIVMSLERRHELLNWAFETGCIIVEDGFDNELNFGAQPQPLFALDKHGVVAFRSNFWRTLYPMVRLGFLVVPPKLAQLVRQLKAMIDRDVPELEQRALGYFLTEGHFERHVKRLRALYGRRRAALLRALTTEFGADAQLPVTSSGMHICVKFSPFFDDALVEKAGTEAGLGLVATNHYYDGDPQPNEFLIDFAHTTEELFDKRIAKFAQALRTDR